MAPAALTIGALDLDEALVARLAATHTVIAWSRRAATGTASIRRSLTIVESIASACAAPIVMSSFPDDHALLSGTLGAQGVLASLPGGAIHVALGLHGRAAIDSVCREHERRGHCFVAAPMLLAVATGRDAVVLGGTADALEKVRPLFDAIGVAILATCERPGDAALLASAHSAMVGCAIEAIAEAFALVRKYGVDAAVMRDVMSDALFAGTVYVPLADAMLSGEDRNAPSTTRGVQILDLALDAANSVHVPLPSADAYRDRLLTAIARGSGERAWTMAARDQAHAGGPE